MSQTGSHVEHKHNPFIKRVSCVDSNMTWTYLASIHDLFINELVVSGLRIVSNFTTLSYTTKFATKLCKRKNKSANLTLNKQEKKRKKERKKKAGNKVNEKIKKHKIR